MNFFRGYRSLQAPNGTIFTSLTRGHRVMCCFDVLTDRSIFFIQEERFGRMTDRFDRIEKNDS